MVLAKPTNMHKYLLLFLCVFLHLWSLLSVNVKCIFCLCVVMLWTAQFKLCVTSATIQQLTLHLFAPKYVEVNETFVINIIKSFGFCPFTLTVFNNYTGISWMGHIWVAESSCTQGRGRAGKGDPSTEGPMTVRKVLDHQTATPWLEAIYWSWGTSCGRRRYNASKDSFAGIIPAKLEYYDTIISTDTSGRSSRNLPALNL